jgi:hypothetical protein
MPIIMILQKNLNIPIATFRAIIKRVNCQRKEKSFPERGEEII